MFELDQSLAKKVVAALDDGSKLRGIDATKQALQERAQQRSAEWQAIRLENATRKPRSAPTRAGKQTRIPSGVTKAPFRAVGQTLDLVGNAFESILASNLTPEQLREGEKAAPKREAEAELNIHLSRYTAGLAQERQNRDQEREAGRRQHRERGGGGRER